MKDHHPADAGMRAPYPADSTATSTPRLESNHLDHDVDGDPDTFEFDGADPRMVLVVWKDAESQGGPTWEDTDEMLEFARRPLGLVRTVGLLLHVDHEQIAITDTVATDQMGGVTKIPRAWVERFEYLAPDGAVEAAEAADGIDTKPEDRERRAG